jgi:hypothetical protein
MIQVNKKAFLSFESASISNLTFDSSEVKIYIDSPRSPLVPGGVKTIKKFPLLSKNYVIDEEKADADSTVKKMGIHDSVVVTLSPEQQKEFRFPTSPKKKVVIDQPTFVSTTSFNVGEEHYQTPTLTTTTAKISERRPKPPRMKEQTPLGVYENARRSPEQLQGALSSKDFVPLSVTLGSSKPKMARGDEVVPDVEHHYGVRNVKSGELDVYAKPIPAFGAKTDLKSGLKMVGKSDLKMAGNLNLLPPELPPRNTPQSSPRASLLLENSNLENSKTKDTSNEG